MPRCREFGPGTLPEDARVISMTLDEFESIRLIDLQGMTQEECARQMDVSRTTAQAIYASARLKLAQSLVNGWSLFINGGDYVLCEEQGERCKAGCGRHHAYRHGQKEE